MIFNASRAVTEAPKLRWLSPAFNGKNPPRTTPQALRADMAYSSRVTRAVLRSRDIAGDSRARRLSRPPPEPWLSWGRPVYFSVQD